MAATSGLLAPRNLGPARTHWWQDARFGLSLHWGIYSVAGRGEWVRSAERLTVSQYRPFIDGFRPRDGWADRWADLAVAAGAKYVVLTAKHHDGFCLWDSKLTDYTAVHSPAGRDLIAEYVTALRKRGLRVGLYYSLVDWHHPDYGPVYGDRQHPLRHDPKQQELDRQRDFSRYVRYMHGQVEELLTRYGTIDVLFFDFSYWDFVGKTWGASELMRLIRRCQSDIVVNDRLSREGIKALHPPDYVGDFDHAEQNIPRERVVNARGEGVPWEAWFTLGNAWAHSATPEPLKSSRTVVHALVNCVSKAGNLCLNVAPDAAGDLPEPVVSTLQEVGRWLAVHGESVYGCGPAALPVPEWGRFTASHDGRHLYAHLLHPVIGHVSLPGLRGRIDNPLVLSTGRPGILTDYWNPGIQTFDAPDDIFFNLAQPVQHTHPLPDPLDTVVRFDIVTDPLRQRALRRQLDDAFDRATARRPMD